MAGFLNVDYKKAVDTSILSAGTYEMGINTVKGDASPGGHECMVFKRLQHFCGTIYRECRRTVKRSGKYLPLDVLRSGIS